MLIFCTFPPAKMDVKWWALSFSSSLPCLYSRGGNKMSNVATFFVVYATTFGVSIDISRKYAVKPQLYLFAHQFTCTLIAIKQVYLLVDAQNKSGVPPVRGRQAAQYQQQCYLRAILPPPAHRFVLCIHQ
jgi:hypothetical protein